jgi:hypothetical protein
MCGFQFYGQPPMEVNRTCTRCMQISQGLTWTLYEPEMIRSHGELGLNGATMTTTEVNWQNRQNKLLHILYRLGPNSPRVYRQNSLSYLVEVQFREDASIREMTLSSQYSSGLRAKKIHAVMTHKWLNSSLNCTLHLCASLFLS